MDVIAVCSAVLYKGQVHSTAEVIKRAENGIKNDFLCSQKVHRCLRSVAGNVDTKWHVADHGYKSLLGSRQWQKMDSLCIFNTKMTRKLLKPIKLPVHGVYNMDGNRSNSQVRYAIDEASQSSCALETNDRERQLKVLESYFSKLDQETEVEIEDYNESSDELELKFIEPDDPRNHDNKKEALSSLENYFGDLNIGTDSTKKSSSLHKKDSKNITTKMPNPNITGIDVEKLMIEESYNLTEDIRNERNQKPFTDDSVQGFHTYKEDSSFYIIGILAAINIAVFLFEIASPIKDSSIEQLSLPLLFGAKINKLILVGEWWRLLTPMFLHSGMLHVAFSCWGLLSFGPQVCKGYGPFTFFLIYLLGGICGNLTSFIHSTDLTVCGTGPVFAVIGAWLVYQTRNKALIRREVSESMFGKAMFATVLSFLLSSSGRIDDWMHLGATLSGVIFGFLTCPVTEMDNASSEDCLEEGFALVHGQADPWKSLATFGAMIFLLSVLVFFLGPELAELDLDDLSSAV